MAPSQIAIKQTPRIITSPCSTKIVINLIIDYAQPKCMIGA